MKSQINAETRERLEALRDALRTEARKAIPEAYSSRGMGDKYLKGDNAAAGAEDAADRIDAILRDTLPDDEQPGEPRGGPWSVLHNGTVIHSGSSPGYARFGVECQTEEEAVALRNRMYARNRIDAWIRENGGEGNWVIRFPDYGDVAVACLTLSGPAFRELTTDRRSAECCADLINRGPIRLTWPEED